jgi:hypothetical protein
MHKIIVSLLAASLPIAVQAQNMERPVISGTLQRQPLLVKLAPPQPTQACIFSQEVQTGRRTCFEPTNGIQPIPADTKIGSFMLPYGYQISFKADTGERDIARQQPIYTHVCGMLQIDANLAYNGGTVMTSCKSPIVAIEYKKMPNITDEQRRLAWRQWATNDIKSCAYKTLSSGAPASTDYRAAFDALGRDECYGAWIAPAGLLGQPRTIGGLRHIIIRSPYARLRLFDQADGPYGNYRDLTCGIHSIDGIVSSDTKFIEVVQDNTPNTCATGITPANDWTGNR